MRQRSDVLDLAILGRLSDGPLHGYELRKRIMAGIGVFRTLSFGSLYPRLRALAERDLITATDSAESPHALAGRRSRIVYELTAAGKEYLAHTLAAPDPTAWDDDVFDLRFRCSPTPIPPPDCASWRAVAPGSLSAARLRVRPMPRIASAGIPTRWSCSATAWNCSTPSLAGSTA